MLSPCGWDLTVDTNCWVLPVTTLSLRALVHSLIIIHSSACALAYHGAFSYHLTTRLDASEFFVAILPDSHETLVCYYTPYEVSLISVTRHIFHPEKQKLKFSVLRLAGWNIQRGTLVSESSSGV